MASVEANYDVPIVKWTKSKLRDSSLVQVLKAFDHRGISLAVILRSLQVCLSYEEAFLVLVSKVYVGTTDKNPPR